MNAEFRINGTHLETGRLLLRPFRQSDLDDFYEYASVEGVGEMAGWRHHENREKSQEILDRFIREDNTPIGNFLLCYADRFVEIRFDPWHDGAAPTEKQMALVGTVLGSGPLS